MLVLDNGPQFTANTFETFLAAQGIQHALSVPFHPATNGLAEWMVQSTKEVLARMGPGDWQVNINTFLLVQHITPSATTNYSPAKLLMGHKLRSKLDKLHQNYIAEALHCDCSGCHR